MDLFQQLKSNQLGVRPNSVTYNILMSACLVKDRPQNVSISTVSALHDALWQNVQLVGNLPGLVMRTAEFVCAAWRFPGKCLRVRPCCC